MKKASKAQIKDVLAIDDLDKADIISVQALARGVADAWQQKKALEVILYKVCGFHDLSFRPGAADETAFAEGMRFCALKINKLLTIDHNTFKE